jgi:FtsP/CotA-like multicopper oxidase with cupredoxin domain
VPTRLSRRSLIQAAGLGSIAAGTAVVRGLQVSEPGHGLDALAHAGHAMGTVGRVSTERFNPMTYLRSWNFAHVPSGEREKFYRETPRPDGTLLREYEFFAVDRELEIAPGVYFPAWTYNGEVPGPTIRATEGDRVRVNFLNQGSHPHSIHFHGWHPPDMDGAFPSQQVQPGERFTYEFDAEPFGLHLYHCHTAPLKRHIHKGLYGTFLIDPKDGRPPADELVMVMNAFDTNFDAENEVYAVNTVANFFVYEPIRVRVGQLVRIYLVNLTEFDLVNSFHLHGMFFDVYRTGTSLVRQDHTDTVMLCQGERVVLETTFRYPGEFMFHAHQSEFAELGWMGTFLAEAGNNAT